MNKNKGVGIAILVAVIAYITNMLFVSQEISIGSSTLALILGSIIAYYVPNIEEGGKWMINIIMPVAIILLGFGLNLTPKGSAGFREDSPPAGFRNCFLKDLA